MKRFIIILCVLLRSIDARAQSSNNASDLFSVPENLGLGLRQLAILDQQDQTQLRNRIGSSHLVMSDSSGRVVVNIHLDGTQSAAEVSTQLTKLGLEIIIVETSWRNGVISAWMPVSQAIAVARLPGIRSVMLAPRPTRNLGVVTAQSTVVERTAAVNTPGVVTPQGLLGRNISIGIISDSYDTAPGVPRASIGVAAGDLPGPGNPDGYTQPVVVLLDYHASDATDEGRGMAELVHDIAPAAKISFSTYGGTAATFSTSIRNLRTDSRTLCDIIVDDITSPDEPFFSDGIVAQAVKDVTTSSVLAGKKVAYFAGSANSGGGYSGDANIISVAVAQSHSGNLQLNHVPANLYAGGFHNFGSAANPTIAMSVTTNTGSGLGILQWDDPFDASGVTTDYNLLVFSASGQYLGFLSSLDNNQGTDEPLELIDLSAETDYQLAICLRTPAPPVATHLRLVSQDGFFSGPLITGSSISLFGHAATTEANCVAAYTYDNTPNIVANYNPNKNYPPPGPYRPLLEDFSSIGGSLPFYFDSQGHRLSTPEIRLKPDFAAVDGVDTSFFPSGANFVDSDNDGFPNFFGTSAAAPNAAAIAALLLEAAGGSTSLTPAQVHSYMQQGCYAHDIDPNFSSASASNGTVSFQVTASGDDTSNSTVSPAFFNASFTGTAGETLAQLTIDLTNTFLFFDPSNVTGLPFTIGTNTSGISVTPSLSVDSRILTLTFGSTFTAGNSLSFGIDRDFTGINAGGNSADYLGGATVTAMTSSGKKLYAGFVNQLGSTFAPGDGVGLLDARRTVEEVVGQTTSIGVPANLSTRGLVGTGDNVLIGGVIITGNAPKKVIVRAIGPSLPVAGALSDPTLELFDANGQSVFDDNWQDDPDQAAQIAATGIPPKDPRESALVGTLAAGGYTAIVRGAGTSTGVAVVEVYDLDNQPSLSRLGNIATRGQVQTQDNILIAGFILSRGPSQVVVRALGPSLASLNVANVLADPSIDLVDNQGNVMMSNDNWQQEPFQAMQIQTIGLAPTNGLDCALTTRLDPGAYTLIVRGAHGTTGVGLVEVYDLEHE